MASDAEILEDVVERLSALYGPKGASPAMVAEMQRALHRFDIAIIDEAVSSVIDNHDRRGWPSLPKIVAACRDRVPASTSKAFVRQAPETPQAVIDEVMGSPLGQTALAEGFGASLEITLRRTGRPLKPEALLTMLRRQHTEAKEAALTIRRDSAFAPFLEGLWQGMGEREVRLRETYGKSNP